jgi:hypothetical protein
MFIVFTDCEPWQFLSGLINKKSPVLAGLFKTTSTQGLIILVIGGFA